MSESLEFINSQFVEKFQVGRKFAYLARAKEFQQSSCNDLQSFKKKILEVKKIAIEEKDENTANQLLYYELLTQTIIWELKMWIEFKEDRPEKAWDYLIRAQVSLSGTVKSFDVNGQLDSYIEKLSLLEELLFPKMIFASMGIIPIVNTCSVCSQSYDNCNHIKGNPYMGELCHVIIEKSVLEEVSIVDTPASKHCRIVSIVDNGVKRNFMTWKETN